MAGPHNAWSGYGTAWAVTATLLAGLGVWGGIGYLVDRWAGTYPLFTPIGLILGVAGGIYLVYVRYGREHDDRKRG
jgi:ATP synthase protein I